MPPTWHSLGDVSATDLVSARESLHQAAHIVQSLGRSILIHRDDDSHATLNWHHERGGLAGQVVNGQRLMLGFADFELLFLAQSDAAVAGAATGAAAGAADDDSHAGDTVVDRLALAGSTLEQAITWLRGLLGRNAAAHTMDVPYDLPEHPVQEGAPFDAPDAGALAELARWYADADRLLSRVVEQHGNAGPVRVWPHHFDMATLLVTEPVTEPATDSSPGPATEPAVGAAAIDAAAAQAELELRTLGVGLSPGDESYAEPYLYVSPWPFPPNIELLPEMPGKAYWHAEGFVAAILRGRDIVAADDQQATCNSFIDAALTAGRDYLEALS